MIVMLKNRVDEVKRVIAQFKDDERGMTATEYAVCAALVSAVVVGAFTTLGANIATVITTLAGTILGGGGGG